MEKAIYRDAKNYKQAMHGMQGKNPCDLRAIPRFLFPALP
jgi:hypothetical protein